MLDHKEAVATVAAVLDDPERSLIGDPRRGVYKVSLNTADMREAMQLANFLVRLGIVPTTTIEHEAMSGSPIYAHVNVYTHADQRALFERVEMSLKPNRRQQLEDLVLARGPIPDELLERMANGRRLRVRPHSIAERLNQEGVIAGMGGKRWTAQKVRKALDEYDRRGQLQEAA